MAKRVLTSEPSGNNVEDDGHTDSIDQRDTFDCTSPPGTRHNIDNVRVIFIKIILVIITQTHGSVTETSCMYHLIRYLGHRVTAANAVFFANAFLVSFNSCLQRRFH